MDTDNSRSNIVVDDLIYPDQFRINRAVGPVSLFCGGPSDSIFQYFHYGLTYIIIELKLLHLHNGTINDYVAQDAIWV